ncbi:MAG: hypothetical protein ACKO9Q_03100, partial [Pirellula sp.]
SQLNNLRGPGVHTSYGNDVFVDVCFKASQINGFTHYLRKCGASMVANSAKLVFSLFTTEA